MTVMARAEAEAAEFTDLMSEIESLRIVALRVKAERDEAIRLLRTTLQVKEMGQQGPHKSNIRAFFQIIGEKP